MRDLHGPTQSRAIRDLLQSLFVIESVQPSQPLWLLSAWVTDAPMLDNSARQFAAIDPEWHAGQVLLSEVLRTILTRGGAVNIVTRPDALNATFMARMRALQSSYSGRLKLLVEENFHEKGLVGDQYELSGSMNFTRAGINVNTEHIIFRTDPATVAERRLELNARWKARLNAVA